MSKEKTIDIKDGNQEEAVEQEKEQETTSEATETSEAGEDTNDEASAEAQEEKDPLEAAHEQIEQLKDQLLRTIAEFDNYKKRTIKEKAELILNGSEKTVTAILPVLDDFERAMADHTDDPTAIKEGMELIFKKFVKTLEGLGVKKIETDNQDFDVDFHEAIATLPSPEVPEGHVMTEVKRGWLLNGKVLRAAQVVVSAGKGE